VDSVQGCSTVDLMEWLVELMDSMYRSNERISDHVDYRD
jgi:hypothetical protein